MDRLSRLENLSYSSFHSDQQKSILFLHGGGCAGWMWQPVVDLLQDYHCIVADLPEHGRSAEIKPFSMKFAALKCAELIQAEAHGSKAVVVGLSEGAQVAVQMLADTPQWVERAFISSALLLPMPGAHFYSSKKIISLLFRMSVPPFRNNKSWIRLNMKYAAGIPEAFFPQFKESFQKMTESQFVNLMFANQLFRLPLGLENIQVPTWVIYGRHEYNAMRQSAQLLTSKLIFRRLFEIDLGRGGNLSSEHNWALTAPQIFAIALKAFLEEKEPPNPLVEKNLQKNNDPLI